MRTLLPASCLSIILLALPGAAWSADKGSADEAVAMVKKAIALIKTDKAKAFAAISDTGNKEFHDRDLYVYVYDLNGVALAHGNNPKIVGKNLMALADSNGKLMIKEMAELAKSPAGHGWVEFKWPNPVTKALENKAGYVERVDDMMVGSGIYK
ncbi:cache domain-containing protein [Massilia sp. P8910]|uniref:cache domain-containing protein n=1 Tax=Massilia antarctica TaxID=2765360 RepID=UPI001E422C00|nr:cache domain-containing protein [Massilia antarctica]MCE3603058.1 cache domain-containing protein [Massilia antarctica]